MAEVEREALCDWHAPRGAVADDWSALKAEIELGLADVADGRVREFDINRIVERGRAVLAGRSRPD